jgi:hypothetical protein
VSLQNKNRGASPFAYQPGGKFKPGIKLAECFAALILNGLRMQSDYSARLLNDRLHEPLFLAGILYSRSTTNKMRQMIEKPILYNALHGSSDRWLTNLKPTSG